MTKISQLSDIGGNLAANDEFIIRDVSDASTPNKKVTASGFFNVATALGFTGLDTIVAGVTNEAKVQVFASGISGRADTTISGVIPARTTISGYFENASGTVGGTLFPVVTQTDIGTDPNQVPVCGMLGGMAFQSPESVSMGTASVDQATISSAAVTAFSNVPLLTGGGLKFPPTQVASADPNTLDDYEEGTHTATLTPSTSGSITLNASYQTLTYTKVGRLVSIRGTLIASSSSSPVGYVTVSLPFTPAAVSGLGYAGGSVFVDAATGVNANQFVLAIFTSGARIYLGDSTGLQSDSAQAIASSGQVYLEMNYHV
jgi:hypothetical protein